MRFAAFALVCATACLHPPTFQRDDGGVGSDAPKADASSGPVVTVAVTLRDHTGTPNTTAQVAFGSGDPIQVDSAGIATSKPGFSGTVFVLEDPNRLTTFVDVGSGATLQAGRGQELPFGSDGAGSFQLTVDENLPSGTNIIVATPCGGAAANIDSIGSATIQIPSVGSCPSPLDVFAIAIPNGSSDMTAFGSAVVSGGVDLTFQAAATELVHADVSSPGSIDAPNGQGRTFQVVAAPVDNGHVLLPHGELVSLNLERSVADTVITLDVPAMKDSDGNELEGVLTTSSEDPVCPTCLAFTRDRKNSSLNVTNENLPPWPASVSAGDSSPVEAIQWIQNTVGSDAALVQIQAHESNTSIDFTWVLPPTNVSAGSAVVFDIPSAPAQPFGSSYDLSMPDVLGVAIYQTYDAASGMALGYNDLVGLVVPYGVDLTLGNPPLRLTDHGIGSVRVTTSSTTAISTAISPD